MTATRLTLQHRGDLGEYHANKEGGATVARCTDRAACAQIVRAVNAHAALVEVIREALDAIDDDRFDETAFESDARDALAKIRA